MDFQAWLLIRLKAQAANDGMKGRGTGRIAYCSRNPALKAKQPPSRSGHGGDM